MAALVVLALLAVVALVWFAARWLDVWEEERELDWRWEQTMRRAGEALDEEPVLFDQDAA